MNSLKPYTLPLLILLYCAWNARSLLEAWRGAPYERYMWIAFLIWCAPLLAEWCMRSVSPQPYLLGAALAVSLLGTLGTVNALSYVGLALALTAFMPWSWMAGVWLLGALAWMPATGWIGSHYFPGYVTGARFALAALPAAWLAFQSSKWGQNI